MTPIAVLHAPSVEARAEVAASEPYYVVVTGDDVNIRCGAGSVWYPVATVASGTVLMTDGAEQGWLRVSYPAGAAAMVRVSDASRSGDGVTLRQPSRLLANNPKGGLSESWRPLLDQELAAGVELRFIDEVRDSSGDLVAFRVSAPAEARGFVSERSVRPATEAEVAQVRGTPATAAKPEPAPTEQPTTAPTQTPTETAAAPAQPPAEEVAVIEEVTPEGTAIEVVETTQAPAPNSAQRAVATMAQLNSAFEALKRVPTEDAEIQPLIAEYQRFIASLSDSAADSGWRRYAESRVELLGARLELQQNLLALKEAEAFATRGSDSISQSMRLMQANPIYKVVGRLGASTVYNGENLPQMYRVQSVEGGVGRTLAYVLPNDELNMPMKLGFIVGVVGEPEGSVVLGLPIFKPSRIDLLTTVQGGSSEGNP